MIRITYSASGLNSPRLILNAMIDLVLDQGGSGVIGISPENHLEDIQALIHEGLTDEFRTAIVGNELRAKVVIQ